MAKIIKREIVVPKLSRKGMKLMQEGACNYETDCKGIDCKQCIYSDYNLDHFISYFDLEDRPGTITVKESIEEEGLH